MFDAGLDLGLDVFCQFASDITGAIIAEETVFQRQVGNAFLQVSRLAAQVLHFAVQVFGRNADLVVGRRARRACRRMSFTTRSSHTLVGDFALEDLDFIFAHSSLRRSPNLS